MTRVHDATPWVRANASADAYDNTMLRRCDWRFLTGTPSPELVLVHGDRALNEAVRAVASRVLDRDVEPAEAECDVVAAQEPDRATLRRLWRALRPGGSCYIEWRSRLAPGPALIRRRLETVGFADVMCYSPRPSPRNGPPQVWLPIDSPPAILWHLRPPQHKQRRTSRVPRTVRRLGWTAARWLPLAAPMCTVARKPPLASDRGRQPDFQSELRGVLGRHRHGGSLARRHERNYVLLTPGSHRLNKLVLLALTQSGEIEFVVKLPRTPIAADALEREATVLRELQAICGDVPGAPRLLFSDTCAGIRIVGETPLDGVPLSQLSHAVDFRACALMAASWQAELLHRDTPHQKPARHVIAPVEAFLDGPVAATWDRNLITLTKHELSRLEAMPVVCEQRDFSPWNVLLTSPGSLAVLDWESGEPHGVPALDLIYFLTYFAATLDGAPTAERVRRLHRSTLDPTSGIGAIVNESLAWYAQRIGLNPSQLKGLRLLCWLVHARSEHERRAKADGRPPEAASLRESTFLALWQQELCSEPTALTA